MTIHIWFDGGSKNNQSKERAGYGSFMVFLNDDPTPKTMTVDRGTKDEVKTAQYRAEFPGKTNNEAEWSMLVLALNYALQLQAEVSQSLEFVLHGDSQNVIGPFNDGNNVKAKNLRPLYEQALGLTEILSIRLVKETGDDVKKVLGH